MLPPPDWLMLAGGAPAIVAVHEFKPPLAVHGLAIGIWLMVS